MYICINLSRADIHHFMNMLDKSDVVNDDDDDMMN